MLELSDTKHLAETRLRPLSPSGTDVRSPTGPYGVALAAVACAVVVRVLLQHTLGEQFLFVPLLAAVAFAAYYGGHGPALTALVVGAAAVTAVIPYARHAFMSGDPTYHLGLILYGLAGYACIFAIDSLRVERDSARRLCAEKERRERDRSGCDGNGGGEMVQDASATHRDTIDGVAAADDGVVADRNRQVTVRQNEDEEAAVSSRVSSCLTRSHRTMRAAGVAALRKKRGEQRRKQLHRHRHRR